MTRGAECFTVSYVKARLRVFGESLDVVSNKVPTWRQPTSLASKTISNKYIETPTRVPSRHPFSMALSVLSVYVQVASGSAAGVLANRSANPCPFLYGPRASAKFTNKTGRSSHTKSCLSAMFFTLHLGSSALFARSPAPQAAGQAMYPTRRGQSIVSGAVFHKVQDRPPQPALVTPLLAMLPAPSIFLNTNPDLLCRDQFCPYRSLSHHSIIPWLLGS